MKKQLVLTMLLLACAVFLPLQASGQTIVQPMVLQYFQALDSDSVTIKATGSFYDRIVNPNVKTNSMDYFEGRLGYIVPLCIGAGGYCINDTHNYGTMTNWYFQTQGAVTYNYNIPFSVEFRLPNTVYPGQRIYLAPTFNWSSPSITTAQDYEFWQVTTNWSDAPFDGLDDLTINYTQYASKGHLYLGIPAIPGMNAITFGGDITVFPFDSGGGSWPLPPETPISTTKLGGRGSLNFSGGTTFNIKNPHPAEVSIGGSGTSEPAWQQKDEYFGLAAYVLRTIPYTSTIGAALTAAQIAGEFQLNSELNGRIYRQDQVNLQISEAYVDVPTMFQQVAGDFDYTVTVKYKVQGRSDFSYILGYKMSFDMRWIDPKVIIDEPLISIPAGAAPVPSLPASIPENSWIRSLFPPTWWGPALTDWIDRYYQFKIKGRTRVVSFDQYVAKALKITPSDFANFSNPPRPVSVTLSPYKAGVKVASAQDPKKVIILPRGMASLPRPTALVGVPLKGQSTVALGVTSQVTAEQIINALTRKGINGFMVAVPGSLNKVITLGSFANIKDAQLLSNMLKEGFQVESLVSQFIDSKSYVPIKSDVLTKLSK